jgi:hypothetical protein
VAQSYVERVGCWLLPPLTGIISAPTLRRDLTLLEAQGYDAATGLYADWRGAEFPAVPRSPTKEDAERALQRFADLYSEVPFVDGLKSASFAVAVSMIISVVIRPALDAVPLHAVTAPEAGSGKSLRSDTASVIATGTEAAAISIGKDPVELEKRLGAELIAGSSIVSLDNCSAPVDGDLINQCLTQPRVKVRILGKSENAEIPNKATVFANGNSLEIVGDAVRRTVKAMLDANNETPGTRIFNTEHPVIRAKRERAELVCAALTPLLSHRR